MKHYYVENWRYPHTNISIKLSESQLSEIESAVIDSISSRETWRRNHKGQCYITDSIRHEYDMMCKYEDAVWMIARVLGVPTGALYSFHRIADNYERRFGYMKCAPLEVIFENVLENYIDK